MLWRKTLVLSLLALILPHLIACKREPAPVATPTPEFMPIEIATRAAEAMVSIESLHFVIERQGALAYIDANNLLAFKRAEGDFKLPENMRAIVRVITAFTPIEIGMIVLGDDQYATDPITGDWGPFPSEWGEFSLIVLFDPETGLQSLLRDGVSGLVLVGQEEIKDQRFYHLTGRASGDRMSAMTLGFIGQGDVDLEVWIDTEHFYVHRLRLIDLDTDPEDPTTWLLEFSNMGEPVDIKAPPISFRDPDLEHLDKKIVRRISAQGQ